MAWALGMARWEDTGPFSSSPSPGASHQSGTMPCASSLRMGSLQAHSTPAAGAGCRSPPHAAHGAPGHSPDLQKAGKQQRVPVMGNTHIWILLQQGGLREKERAGRGVRQREQKREQNKGGFISVGYQTAQGGEPMGTCSPSNTFLAPLLGAGC